MYQIKDIPNKRGYKADTNGDIWSSWKRIGTYRKGSRMELGDKLTKLKGTDDKDGYLLVTLSGKTERVHRMIALTFMPNGYGDVVCHNDGNKKNNTVDNLRWDTAKGNVADIYKHGKMWFGDKNSNAKLNKEKASLIRYLYNDFKWSQQRIANLFNVNQTAISSLLRGKTWADNRLFTNL